jgi:hypothetical protein
MKTSYWIGLIALAFVAGLAVEYLSSGIAEGLGPWKCATGCGAATALSLATISTMTE